MKPLDKGYPPFEIPEWVNLMAHFILWDENSASEDEINPTDTCERALLL